MSGASQLLVLASGSAWLDQGWVLACGEAREGVSPAGEAL